jgi:Zn-dependent alcohol dehydrogenase
MPWKLLPGLRRGDWRSKLIHVAQALVGLVAVVALVAMLTLSPYWLLGFTAVQGLLVLGVVLFVVVAIFAQRALVEEEFGAGEVIFNEGDTGRDVYVIRSGTVEVVKRRGDGTPEVIRQLGAGDHFGEMALLGNLPRNATIRTVTAVQVYKMGRNGFATLYTTLPGVKEHFNRVVETRLQELKRRA